MNIKEQKRRLIEEQAEVEKDLNQMGKKINDDGDWIVVMDLSRDSHADDLDNAQNTSDMEGKIAILNVLEQRHEQVARALRAIENDTYGICEESGCEIASARLEANPSATTCISHAS